MDARYNVYFDGQLLEGREPDSVRDKLAKLFKADQATLERLFSGKTQLIKRDCDKATALKYKQAIEQAGARPIIKAAPVQAPPAEPAAKAKTMTAAERIASLAGAPDAGKLSAGEDKPVEFKSDTGAGEDTGSGKIDLAPEGTDVLLPEERAEPVHREVDTSTLNVDQSDTWLSGEPIVPPPAPDTSHLSAAAVGETLPTLKPDVQPVSPNTDSLDLSPSGTDFSDCAPPAAKAPALDLSGMDLAPTGTDVLEERYRKKAAEKAPATDHISLQE